MSDFRTHVLGGIVTGATVSGAHALFLPGVLDHVQLGAVCLMGIIGGVLPDLDSDTGKPLSILFGLLALIIPAVMLKTVSRFHDLSPEFLICYFAVGYFLINYVARSFIKKITVHRGIMHSIPFVLVCGICAFFLFSSSGENMALAVGIAVSAGGITHLVMDEFHSLSWSWGVPRRNKASGSAFKFTSSSILSTMLIYGILMVSSLYMLKTMGLLPRHVF